MAKYAQPDSTNREPAAASTLFQPIWGTLTPSPNLLTLSRILAVPILVFLLWRPSWWDYGITFVLYCLVGITDYFDGYLARAQGTVSRLGVFLDPIADKIMVVAVIAMLISTRQPGAVLDEGTRAALDRVLAWTAQQEGAAWILG